MAVSILGLLFGGVGVLLLLLLFLFGDGGPRLYLLYQRCNGYVKRIDSRFHLGVNARHRVQVAKDGLNGSLKTAHRLYAGYAAHLAIVPFLLVILEALVAQAEHIQQAGNANRCRIAG